MGHEQQYKPPIVAGVNSPVAIGQAQFNANNQLTSRSVGLGRMFFSNHLDKEATVTVAGTEATIDHRTMIFSAYDDVASGTNVIPAVAADYNGNSITNCYQVVTTDNGFAATSTFDLISNHFGSIWEMVDAAGTIQARYDYDPYGLRTKVGYFEVDFGSPGHFFHSPIGIWLTLFRAYDPDLGRWLSRDPFEEQGRLKLYGYAESYFT